MIARFGARVRWTIPFGTTNPWRSPSCAVLLSRSIVTFPRQRRRTSRDRRANDCFGLRVSRLRSMVRSRNSPREMKLKCVPAEVKWNEHLGDTKPLFRRKIKGVSCKYEISLAKRCEKTTPGRRQLPCRNRLVRFRTRCETLDCWRRAWYV